MPVYNQIQNCRRTQWLMATIALNLSFAQVTKRKKKKKRILTADSRCASNDFIIKRENIARNKNIIFEFLQAEPSINYQALDVTHSWSINTQKKAARESRWLGRINIIPPRSYKMINQCQFQLSLRQMNTRVCMLDRNVSVDAERFMVLMGQLTRLKVRVVTQHAHHPILLSSP